MNKEAKARVKSINFEDAGWRLLDDENEKPTLS